MDTFAIINIVRTGAGTAFAVTCTLRMTAFGAGPHGLLASLRGGRM